MKTAIVYYSKHHGNTKKLLDAIAAEHEVTLIDVTQPGDAQLSDFDRIGFASGIYYNSFAKQILNYAKEHLPEGKQVFFLNTCGAPRKNYFDAIRSITEERNCSELGAYQCLGFDTFGPFKLMGGIAKGHPTGEEIQKAVTFYRTTEYHAASPQHPPIHRGAYSGRTASICHPGRTAVGFRTQTAALGVNRRPGQGYA